MMWRSGTVATWASFGSRSLQYVLVLPIAALMLPDAELAVWLIFVSMISVRVLFDLGLYATFSRFIASAMGGAQTLRADPLGDPALLAGRGQANWTLIASIVAATRFCYAWLAVVLFLGFASVGSWLMQRPIAQLDSQDAGWYAWAQICLTLPVGLYGGRYLSLLVGMDKIALFRRTEAVCILGGNLAAVGLFLAGQGILEAVMAVQGFALINVLINRHHYRKNLAMVGRIKVSKEARHDVLGALWPQLWRSSVGILMTTAVIHLTGFAYAQYVPAAEVAAYLLVLHYVLALNQFSQAPFYAKLPKLAGLRASGRQDEFRNLAITAISRALWCYALGGVLMIALLEAGRWMGWGIMPALNPWMLWIMLLAFYAERVGAMHLQIHSLSNHIIWHIANGLSGVILIICSYVLYPIVGALAFALAILVAYAGFYSWYSARFSYKVLETKAWAFERMTSFRPGLILVVCVLLSILADKGLLRP